MTADPGAAARQAPQVAVLGEALIDFMAQADDASVFRGREGGASANVAIATARLGVRSALVTQLSRDLFGERLLAHLVRNGVDTRHVLRTADPTTLAFVERTPTTNRYAFHLAATAAASWAPAETWLPPEGCTWLQFGSVALLNEPASSAILASARAAAGRCLRLFDPNVRPSVIGDADAYRARCTGWMADADLVKLSDEDAAFLAPGQPLDAAVVGWLVRGPRAVVLTRGAAGATLYRPDQAPLHVRAPAVAVRDTVGAGDTFCAGLMVALLEQGVPHADALARLPDAAWQAALRVAAAAAALTCTREGADPPLRAALDAALQEPAH